MLGIAAALAGCVERARIGFEPDPEENEGPNATIDVPETAEVTVPAGPFYNVAGRVADADGVDTVYFELFGIPEQFQPHVPATFDDTVTFSIPITTAGREGTAVTILVFGTDSEGVRGDTASRRVVIE
ncbi:MAG TPA: hypothetical protein VFT04_14660 [Gemmatimonadales bacterium]|nr:hypothetical protein [Gemmatimonadales bacterium]